MLKLASVDFRRTNPEGIPQISPALDASAALAAQLLFRGFDVAAIRREVIVMHNSRVGMIISAAGGLARMLQNTKKKKGLLSLL